jgi:hypothetical protein
MNITRSMVLVSNDPTSISLGAEQVLQQLQKRLLAVVWQMRLQSARSAKWVGTMRCRWSWFIRRRLCTGLSAQTMRLFWWKSTC